ncbi:MAG: HAD family phosphatase [Caulobacteraceae bacterium]|nr:HAD family phosphatase [Caulobacteraceae bacterium]
MKFVALATDYDGTLAREGAVAPATVLALERLKQAGRKLIMVTGRELPDLRGVFERLELFDAVVAENGALLFLPATGEERPLAPPPPPGFVQALRDRGAEPLSAGNSIVATREPYETAALEVIREFGLEWQVIFNKGAVMCLPAGVNKASGLAAALAELEVSAHDVVAVGDAENDHAFLAASGLAVAVANAVASLKAEADLVTEAPDGAGVAELADRLLEDRIPSGGLRSGV